MEALGKLGSRSVLQDDPEVRKNTAIFSTVVKNIETPTDHSISIFIFIFIFF